MHAHAPPTPTGLPESRRDLTFQRKLCAPAWGECLWCSHSAGPDRSTPTGPASPNTLGFTGSLSLFPFPQPQLAPLHDKIKRNKIGPVLHRKVWKDLEAIHFPSSPRLNDEPTPPCVRLEPPGAEALCFLQLVMLIWFSGISGNSWKNLPHTTAQPGSTDVGSSALWGLPCPPAWPRTVTGRQTCWPGGPSRLGWGGGCSSGGTSTISLQTQKQTLIARMLSS